MSQPKKSTPPAVYCCLLPVSLLFTILWLSTQFTPPKVKQEQAYHSTALVSIEAAERLSLGMTRGEVEALLGPPGMTSADIAQYTGKPLPVNDRDGYFYDVPNNGQCIIGFRTDHLCYAVITNGDSQTIWKIDNGL